FYKNTKASAISTSTYTTNYPIPDEYLNEKLQPNEKKLAQEISTVIEESIRKEYAPGKALRDAHPKAHGCVRAEFHVLKNIPTQLAKG
ncbi:catalase, partial [Acinetobacter baumannii]